MPAWGGLTDMQSYHLGSLTLLPFPCQARNREEWRVAPCQATVCELRDQCTKNKMGRTLKKHLRQNELDLMRQACQSAKAKRDIKTRQHLMERSFARAKRYGYDRARWRGLWKMQIQEYLICAIQNIQVLIGCGSLPKKSQAMALKPVKITILKRLAANLDHLMLSVRFLVTSSTQMQRAMVHFCN